jgi:transposase
VGPIIASAIVAASGNGSNFKNGRHFAAWIGLVPKHAGTGGKIKVQGISKRGDRYLRKLIIQGAHSVVRWAKKDKTLKDKWILSLLKNKPTSKVVVALANKTARIIWAVLQGHEYKENKAYALIA